MVSMQIAALALALANPGETVLLDFTATWCAPCRMMNGTMSELEAAGYPIRKVDIDREPQLAQRYSVQSVPCFVLLVNGQEVGRETGACRRGQLLALFERGGVRPSGGRDEVARGQSPDAQARGGILPRQRLGNPLKILKGRQEPEGRVAAAPILPNEPDQGPTDLAPSEAPTMQDLIQSSVRLTIQDATGTSYGSGTIIDARQGEALVLTCGHVFRDSQGKGQISVDLFGPQAPQKIPGRLIAFDADKQDIGLVSIRPGVPVKVAPVAPKGHQFGKGDRVVTVGCNHGGPATALESKITSIDKFLGAPNVQVSGMPVQGRSGGGLFNADGQVIGVCNAADPTDNEGLYAALATIHGQLDQAGLSVVYETRAKQGPAGNAALAGSPRSRAAAAPNPEAAGAGLNNNASLNDAERATLAEVAKRGDSAEVICIVRSLSDPKAKSEVILLDRASSAFLKQLAVDREAQQSRHLTSFEPGSAPKPQHDPLVTVRPRTVASTKATATRLR